MSNPVLTNYGYHLILISDNRSSDYQYMDDLAYENLIINITKNSIREKLRHAAVEYDNNIVHPTLGKLVEYKGAYSRVNK